MLQRNTTCAIALLGLLLLSGLCFGAEIRVDVLDPANGVRRCFSHAGARPMPLAPWLRNNPSVMNLAREHQSSAGVDDARLSPVYQEHARRQFRTPVSGTWKILVLLVDFRDHPAQLYPGVGAKAHFISELLSRGSYPTGSMRDWYREVSYNTFDVGGTVLGRANGWLRAPQTYAYYAYNQRGFGSYPHNSARLAEDMIAIADPLVNFSQYDNDRDGTVDGLFILHSGPGYETTGRLSDLHSCMWAARETLADGVRVQGFCLVPEDGKVGVFGHEFGHMLGLPDLYDYDYDSAGIGYYSMMSSGSWGGGGDTPVHFDAYCKQMLGWNQPTVVTTPRAGTPIPQAETSRVAYRLAAGATGQYFLIENRQRVGFDALLPGTGLCIWHVDETMGQTHQWYPGMSGPWHYHVALEQADGLWDLEHNRDLGDDGDPFPGTRNKRSFNFATIPSSSDYLEEATHVTVSRISDSSPNMTADLCGVNRAPLTPERVTILPAAPVPTSILIAGASPLSDPDREACTVQYSWSKWTGSAWGSWGHASSNGRLTGVTLRAGDRWQARARVFDGSLYSATRRSAAVTVAGGSAAPAAALAMSAAGAPAGSHGAAITVDLSADAAVEVEIRNLAGTLIGSIPSRQLPAGVSDLLWNGHSVRGTAVPAGTYLLKVIARAGEGSQAQALASLCLK